METQYERVGVTGTREGATAAQLARLLSTLWLLRDRRGAKYLHHGDCLGVDQQAAEMARELGYTIVGHPPKINVLRAFFPSDEEREPDEYLPRDRKIADEVDLLIGLPADVHPRPRSGTWYTIKYAREIGRTVAIIQPNGTWAA